MLTLRAHRVLTALTLTALATFSLAAHADTFTGTTIGGPTWNRPLANGNAAPTSLSGVGTNVAYNVFTFSVDTSGSYTFLSTSTNPANWDNYTVLYNGPFSPTAQLTNIVVANDDDPSIGHSGFTSSLTSGTTYEFITTGFANTDVGDFSNDINGPGIVNPATSTPEPSSYAAFAFGGLGLLGLALKTRTRRTTA